MKNDRNDPDNIALWKHLYKYEEAPTNSTGPAVSGTNGNPADVFKKKKKKSKIVKRPVSYTHLTLPTTPYV